MEKKLFITIFSVFLSLNVLAQIETSSRNIISIIDSISKAEGIKKAAILYNKVDESFGNTDTSPCLIVEKDNFKFVGNLLVLKNYYFNMDKLLYFEIKKGIKNVYIEFYFQGY